MSAKILSAKTSCLADKSAADTFAADTFAADTFAADNFAADNFAADTFAADTSACFRGGLMSAADNSPPKALADDILADLSASPRRIRRESAWIRLDPPRIRGGQVSATYRAHFLTRNRTK